MKSTRVLATLILTSRSEGREHTEPNYGTRTRHMNRGNRKTREKKAILYREEERREATSIEQTDRTAVDHRLSLFFFVRTIYLFAVNSWTRVAVAACDEFGWLFIVNFDTTGWNILYLKDLAVQIDSSYTWTVKVALDDVSSKGFCTALEQELRNCHSNYTVDEGEKIIGSPLPKYLHEFNSCI